VRAQLRSELLKQRSTRTNLGLLAGMLGLVVLAVFLHVYSISVEELGETSNQLMILGRGEFLGALFAGLLGAMSITTEIRYGSIRPTFLVSPRRGRVVAAKLGASTLLGAGLGLAASAVAAAAGAGLLRARGVDLQPDGGDYALLIAGGTAASALWAAIGFGVGALVRNQVPTLIGISAWTLFVEGLFGENLIDIGRYAPGQLGMAISGQEPDTLLAPGVAVLLLAVWAGVAATAGWVATERKDLP
jgi:ABC-2 type transport system permease protein